MNPIDQIKALCAERAEACLQQPGVKVIAPYAQHIIAQEMLRVAFQAIEIIGPHVVQITHEPHDHFPA